MSGGKTQKRLLSGLKPTGRLHIGNYYGAMRQFIEMQKGYDAYVFVANYHAMTTAQNADELKAATLEVAVDYIAAGLDPEHITLYMQSDVPEVHELTWIFNCLTTVPYLQRAHAYKDALAKNTEPSVGTFDYPMLMAADILIQNADVVPVGKDQKQHVEFARDTAEKFNRIYETELFKLPEPVIPDNAAVIPGTDGQKMSKSYNNVIPLFGTDEELKKATMSIPTDSRSVEEPKDPETCNVFQLHKLVSTHMLDELTERYTKGGLGYGESKEILVKNLIAMIEPMRDKRAELLKKPEYVLEIFKEGGEKARANAIEMMDRVREATGIERSLT